MPQDDKPANEGSRPQAGIVGPRNAWILLCLVIAVWGANWPVMKVALGYVPPLTFAVARLVLGGLCLTAVLMAGRRFRLPSRQDMPIIFSIAIFQLAGFLAFVHTGLQYVDAGRAAILSYTTLIWVTPIAVLFLGEKLTVQKTIGLLCGLGGVVALFNPAAFDWSDRTVLIGNGCLLAGALVWAISILHVRTHAFRLSPLQLAPWQMLAAAVPLAVLAAFRESDAVIAWSWPLWGAFVFNGAFATGFALWAWLTVARALPAITTSIGSLGVPVVGLGSSALILGETITIYIVAGFALILMGLAAISMESVLKRGSR